eukprot:1158508-Pelagomonas_calceolata.AAC.4
MAGEGKREMRQCRPDPYLVKTRASMRAPAQARTVWVLRARWGEDGRGGVKEEGGYSSAGLGKAQGQHASTCPSAHNVCV